MNKKCLLTALLVSLGIGLVSCDKPTDDEVQKIIDSFNNANKSALRINQNTTIKKKDMVIATQDSVYNFQTGEKITTTRKLNPLTYDEVWSETTTKEAINPNIMGFTLTKEMINNLTLDNGSLDGTVSNEKVLSVFGIDGSEISGDLNITFVADLLNDFKITSVLLSYLSLNNNTVEIEVSYTYY